MYFSEHEICCVAINFLYLELDQKLQQKPKPSSNMYITSAPYKLVILTNQIYQDIKRLNVKRLYWWKSMNSQNSRIQDDELSKDSQYCLQQNSYFSRFSMMFHKLKSKHFIRFTKVIVPTQSHYFVYMVGPSWS